MYFPLFSNQYGTRCARHFTILIIIGFNRRHFVLIIERCKIADFKTYHLLNYEDLSFETVLSLLLTSAGNETQEIFSERITMQRMRT